MNQLDFSLFTLGGSLLAGLLGSLTGLGGGVVLAHADYAVQSGYPLRHRRRLVSVIATSSGAAAAFVREGYSNIRIGMFLEIATTLGAVGGALLATRTPTAYCHSYSAGAAAFGLQFTRKRADAKRTRSLAGA